MIDSLEKKDVRMLDIYPINDEYDIVVQDSSAKQVGVLSVVNAGSNGDETELQDSVEVVASGNHNLKDLLCCDVEHLILHIADDMDFFGQPLSSSEDSKDSKRELLKSNMQNFLNGHKKIDKIGSFDKRFLSNLVFFICLEVFAHIPVSTIKNVLKVDFYSLLKEFILKIINIDDDYFDKTNIIYGNTIGGFINDHYEQLTSQKPSISKQNTSKQAA